MLSIERMSQTFGVCEKCLNLENGITVIYFV